MTLDPDLLELFETTVTCEPRSGQDANGNDTYGAPVADLAAHIDDRGWDSGGGEEPGSMAPITPQEIAVLFLEVPVTLYKPGDRFTLADSTVMYLRDSKVFSDEEGHHHMVVTLQTGRVGT